MASAIHWLNSNIAIVSRNTFGLGANKFIEVFVAPCISDAPSNKFINSEYIIICCLHWHWHFFVVVRLFVCLKCLHANVVGHGVAQICACMKQRFVFVQCLPCTDSKSIRSVRVTAIANVQHHRFPANTRNYISTQIFIWLRRLRGDGWNKKKVSKQRQPKRSITQSTPSAAALVPCILWYSNFESQ